VVANQFPGIALPTDEVISTTWAVEKLKNDFSALQIQEKMLEAAKLTMVDPQGAVKYLRAEMHAMAEDITPRHSRTNMALNIDERRQRYLERTQGDSQGVTLGIPELDAWTNGLLPSELAVIGAYSKTGKTMFLANAAVAARNAGLLPIFFTLEMPKGEIEDRIDAMFSGLSYDRLSHSRLTIEEMSVLHEKQAELAALGDLLIEQPEGADRTAAALVNRARHVGANLIIIDQLSEMEAGRRTKDLKEHHSVCMKQLKTELGRGSAGRLPALLAVQLNRESQTRREGIGLDSFANATEIEAICDLALGLWRNPEMVKNATMKLQILGARRSGLREWLLHWHLIKRTEISVERVIEDLI
jgi:replicative DNA helicase